MPQTIMVPCSAPDLLLQNDNTVSITVGPKASTRTFKVYEYLLCSASEFFERTFQGSFAAASTKAVVLDDVDPAVFSVFLQWIRQRVVIAVRDPIDDFWRNIEQIYADLLELYILADRLQVRECKTDVIIAWQNIQEQNMGQDLSESEGTDIILPAIATVVKAVGMLPDGDKLIGYMEESFGLLWTGPFSDDEIMPSTFLDKVSRCRGLMRRKVMRNQRGGMTLKEFRDDQWRSLKKAKCIYQSRKQGRRATLQGAGQGRRRRISFWGATSSEIHMKSQSL